MSPGRLGIIIATSFAALISSLAAVRAEDTSAIVGIRPAVVFINLQDESEVGSGVVVRTSKSGTYIVTAGHVASAGTDIDVYYEDDLTRPHRATVVKVDKDLDLAILRTDGLAPTQASLSDGSTSGTAIAVLGYPAAATARMINKTGKVQPISALGTVTSVRSDGALLLTNARTEPGDSGAPIFEQDNAEIVGIVTGQFGNSKRLGFQATGVAALRSFLKSAGIAFQGAQGGYGAAMSHDETKYQAIVGRLPLPQGPGSGRMLVDIFDPGLGLHSGSNTNLATVEQMRTFISGDLQTILGDGVHDAFNARLSDDRDTLHAVMMVRDELRAMYEHNYIAAIDLEVYVALKSATVLQDVANVDVYTRIMDRSGNTFFQGHGHETLGKLIGDPQERDVERAVAKATKGAIEATRQDIARIGGGDDAAKNFARYGVPVASGQKSALFLVKPDPKGARVSEILPYGTAAQGQLQKNDLIIALDGEDLANLPPDKLMALFDHHGGPLFRCTVLEPDGQTVVITFQPQDIRWYQENTLRYGGSR